MNGSVFSPLGWSPKIGDDADTFVVTRNEVRKERAVGSDIECGMPHLNLRGRRGALEKRRYAFRIPDQNTHFDQIDGW